MITFLRILFATLFIIISYTVIATSLESNLFEEWDFLASIPWMQATLIDFYINEIIIYLWVLHREEKILPKILWAVLFFGLGSIATTFYVLIQLFIVNADDPIQKVLIKNYRG